MTGLLSLFSDWKIAALAVLALLLVAGGLLLRHEIAVNGALTESLSVAERAARNNAAAAEKIRADAARDMTVVQATLSRLCAGIIAHENAGYAYPDSAVAAGVARALEG